MDDDERYNEIEEKLSQDRARRSRLRKWDRISRKGVDSFLKTDDFWRRVKYGIPQEHRWNVWKSSLLSANSVPYRREAQEREKALFSSSPTASSCMAGLLSRESTWHDQILYDSARTFAELPAFTEDHEASLIRVLNAYAFLNPEVGYVEGMCFIAGTLLLVSEGSESETLLLFVRLMEDCGLNGFYKNGRPLLKHFDGLFKQLMEELLPDLKCHFEKEGVESSDYLMLWFLSLFAFSLPMETVLLVWDIIMCKGLPYLVLVAAALLSSVQHVLLSKQHEEILQFFHSMTNSQDAVTAAEVGRCLTQHIREFNKTPNIQSVLGSRPDVSADETMDNVRTFELEPDRKVSSLRKSRGRRSILPKSERRVSFSLDVNKMAFPRFANARPGFNQNCKCSAFPCERGL
jgi:hypothetical protein